MPSIKSVAEKMGIKSDSRACIVQAPEDAMDALELPALRIASRLTGEFDYIHFFVRTQRDLEERFPKLKAHLGNTGMLWISWPKAGQLESDLTLKTVIRIGYNHGLVESKTLSVDATWSAIKFTHPKKGKVYSNHYGKLKS